VIGRALSHLVEGVLLVLMVVLCVDVFLGVFSRYVLGRTFTWYDEIARLCFVWIVFLGAAVGVRRSAHFRLHLVVDRLPPALQNAANVVSVAAIAGFGALLIWQGRLLVELGQFQTTPVMGLSKQWIYASLPAGGVLMILYALPLLWRRPPAAH
jgi:TRAP-type C4-dicarboxylate transport system permease small subunit